jgi:chemotaxis protein MotB
MSAQAAAAHAKAGRRKKHDEHEEHENEERWLITYADMITLLMVLFIVLFSIGQTDLAKFEKLKEGLASSFGNEAIGVLEAGGLLADGPGGLTPDQLAAAQDALAARDAARAAIAADQAALQSTEDTLAERLQAAGVADEVNLRVERRGLIVTIVTDQVLFQPGSDTVLGAGQGILTTVAGALAELPNPISVEGHTDDVPISTSRFASNWELSTARATSVLRLLETSAGLDPERLSAAGYADTKPIADNATPQGRAANRRVEVVVHSLVDEADVVGDIADTESPPTTISAIADPIPEANHGEEEG